MINKEIQNTFIDKQINTGMSKGENRAELNNTPAKIHTKQQALKIINGAQATASYVRWVGISNIAKSFSQP